MSFLGPPNLRQSGAADMMSRFKIFPLLFQTFCLGLCFHLHSFALAQSEAEPDAFVKQQQRLVANNPAGLNFIVKLKDDKIQFHAGEKIRLELSFSASLPDTYVFDNATYDRSGRLEMDRFVVDQTDAVTDPLSDYYHKNLEHMMGGLRGIDALRPAPQVISYDLNEWLRFEKPGKYRLYVISHRVTRGKPQHSGNTPVEPVSNPVEFEIIPATREWEQATLAAAARILDAPKKTSLSVGESQRRSACRVLRFLDSESAIKEMIGRFRGEDQECDSEYFMGLVGAPNHGLTIRQMEIALDGPSQPVSSNFLSALVSLASTEQNPDGWQEFPNDDAGRKAGRAQWERWRTNYDLIVQSYLDRLANAIAHKERTAAAMSLQTVLTFHASDQSTAAARKKSLIASLIKVFFDLPPESQRNLIDYSWKQISDPAMLPVLRQLYEHPPDLYERPQPFPGIALRRIYELAPAEGRQLILEEMKRPRLRVTKSVLSLLPDKELPEVEDAIVRRAIERHDENSTALIPRYVSAASLPRLRASFENHIGTMACLQQADLISYFLRTDPDFGIDMIRKAIRSREQTGCYTSVLTDAARDSISPEFETLALTYLDDDDPQVAFSAVHVLCKHGSIANKPQIRATIARIINRWREAKVDPEAMTSRDGYYPGFFAESLLRAYALAIPWVTTADELKELADLCLTEQCRRELKPRDLMAETGIRSYCFNEVREECTFTIGEYETLSWTPLTRKAIQYPKGTRFTWQPDNNEQELDEYLFTRVQNYLKENGFELVRFEPPKSER
jgi:hypothetical protein